MNPLALMQYGVESGQAMTLSPAQMDEVLKTSAAVVEAKNDLVRENIELRERLAAEELRRT